MPYLRKVSFIVVLVLALAVFAAPAQAYWLLDASVTPSPVSPGDEITVCFTLGDDRTGSDHPYEVEAWFGPKDASEFFNCGQTFGYNGTKYHSPAGLLPPSWLNRASDLNTDGMTLIYQSGTSLKGSPAGTEACFNWTLPDDLVEGQTYFVHLLVGYPTECVNWTHYTLPLELDFEPTPPVVMCGITGTYYGIGNWRDNLLESTNPIGGVFYWVEFNTGDLSVPWTVQINDPSPAGGFELHGSGSAVQVYYDGMAYENIRGRDFTGTWMSGESLPPDTTVTLRVHYKWNRSGAIPETYTFSSSIVYGDDVFLANCSKDLYVHE